MTGRKVTNFVVARCSTLFAMRRLSLQLQNLFRLAAFVLVSGIGADLVDLHCDTPTTLNGSSIVASSPFRPADDCGDSDGVCVPDCFCCCARTVPAAYFSFAGCPMTFAFMVATAAGTPLAGAPPSLYRPPLPRA